MTEQPQALRPRRRWPLIAGSLVLITVVVVAAWWVAGRRVWTDDDTIRLPASQVDLRQVLWTPAKALAPVVNTPQEEYEPAISPDGTELFFVRGLPGAGADIYVSTRRNNAWTEPAPIEAINTSHDELGPRLMPDGNTLVFYSDREGGQGGYDVWAAPRTAEGWGQPYNLGPAVNSPYNDYGAAPTPDGKSLYFASNRKAAIKLPRQAIKWRATIREAAQQLGDYDLFIAPAAEPAQSEGQTAQTTQKTQATAQTQRQTEATPAAGAPVEAPPVAGAPVEPTPLEPAPAAKLAFGQAVEVQGLNTPYHEGAPCVSSNGDFLYFASNRPGGFGGFDIYRVRLRRDGRINLENLGPQVNSTFNEADPQLAMGGFRIYFSSDRALADNADTGSYDLFTADSREVFADRIARTPPHVGWSWWLLLGALLLLLPLFMFFRDGNTDRLNTLQKCLLISLIAHLLLTALFSFVMVSHEIYEVIKREAGMEVAVNLEVSREVEVKMETRQQLSQLPVADPVIQEMSRADVDVTIPSEPLVVQPSELNVPKAQIRPAKMTLQAEAPKAVPRTPTDDLSVPPPPIEAETPTLELEPQQRVAQLEKPIQVNAPQPTPAQRQNAPQKQSQPEKLTTPTPQPAAPDAQSLAKAVDPQRPLPDAKLQSAPVEVKIQDQTQVSAPRPNAAPVRAAEAPLPQPTKTAQDAASNRQPTPAAAPTPPKQLELAAAPAQLTAESLARVVDAARPVPKAQQVTAPRDVKVQDQTQVDAPQPTASPVRVAEAQPAQPTKTAEAATVSRQPTPATVEAPPQKLTLAAAPTELSAQSLARMVEAAKPAPSAPAVDAPVEVKFDDQPDVAAPKSNAAPVRVAEAQSPLAPDTARPTSVDRQQAPLVTVDAPPQQLALAATPAQPTTDSLARPADPSRPVPQARRVEAQPQLAFGAQPEVAAIDVQARQPRVNQIETPLANQADTPTGTLAQRQTSATPTATTPPQQLALAAAPLSRITESIAKAAAASVSVPDVKVEPVAVDLSPTIDAQPEVSTLALTAASARVSQAEGAVKSDSEPSTGQALTRRQDAAAPPASAQPQQLALAAPRATAAESIARVAVAAPAAPDLKLDDIAIDLAAAVDVQPQLTATAAVAPVGAPIKSSGAETPTVAEASSQPQRLGSSSPRGKASAVKVAIPSAQSTPDSLVVAASTDPRPAPAPTPLAIDVPTVSDSVQLTLPAVASRQSVAEQAPVGAPLESPQPLKPKAISTVATKDRPSDLFTPAELVANVDRSIESLARQTVTQTLAPRITATALNVDQPQPAVEPLLGSLGPGKLSAPESLFQRSFQQRKKLVKELGGSEKSEDAVERALKYLARNQEADGRWTKVTNNKPVGKRGRDNTDSAQTGLALLCFMAADHTPNKPGPYRQTVTNGLEYLLAHQKKDGDLRNGGDMYTQGIATLAIAEMGIMTKDPRCRDAAFRAAEFILRAQHGPSGGWRYSLNQFGDTSVVGWQVMALHSSELLGFTIPQQTRDGAFRWLNFVTPKGTLLAGYQNPSATTAMSAEAMFSRILLGEQFEPGKVDHACEYFLDHPPGKGEWDYYYWYYASLAMMQLQDEHWEKWNSLARDFLIKQQRHGGDMDGSWDLHNHRDPRGGRIYTTALATLTLEVYYRYLPMYRGDKDGK